MENNVMVGMTGLKGSIEGNHVKFTLTEQDLIDLLERKARGTTGNTQAIKLLMEYRSGVWPKKDEPQTGEASVADELSVRRSR